MNTNTRMGIKHELSRWKVSAMATMPLGPPAPSIFRSLALSNDESLLPILLPDITLTEAALLIFRIQYKELFVY